ncbi:Nn.00g023160.m01.CDS01 [Neocucurbitaria sp. VM-36]
MNIFKPFTSPRDPRWQGFQRRHHTIFLVKNLTLLLFIILVIVEYSLFITWWNTDSESSLEYAPYAFWFRIGIALIPDALYTLLTLSLIFQTPHLSLKNRTWTFHPAFALTFSIVLFGLYVSLSFLNAQIIGSNEISFHNVDSWYTLGYVELGFQGVLGLCYLGMMVCACVAVHRWRVGKKGGGRYAEVEKEREGGDV